MMRLLILQLSLLVLSHTVVRRLWPGNAITLTSYLVRVPLLVLLALAGGSLLFFLALVLGIDPQSIALAESAFCLVASAALHLLAKRQGSALPVVAGARATHGFRALESALLLTMILAAGLSFAHFAVHAASEPHGRWDAYSIWNLRARFMARGGSQWQAAFDRELTYAHVDYPLLLPAAVANAWNALGHESTLAPRAIALAFTFAGFSLLVGGLAVTRDVSVACLAGLALLAGNNWIDQGWSQYADVPLASFILATLVLLAINDQAPLERRGLLVLAGLTAGCAAWTKNEGCLFLVCLVFARCSMGLLNGGVRSLLRDCGWMGRGLAPVLAVLLLFKLYYAGSNDLVENQSLHTSLARLSDISRYRTIGQHLAACLVQVPIPVLLGLGAAGCGLRPAAILQREVASPTLCLITMCCGYSIVYLTTPHDLAWHLRTSLDRVVLHIYPAALFTFFLAVRSPAETLDSLAFRGTRLPAVD